MRLHSFLPAAALAVLAASTATAQASSSFGPFVAYTGGRNISAPVTAGAQMTVFSGLFGIRGSGAILLDDRSRLDASAPNGWDIDGDLVMRLGHAGGASFSLVPYAFTGIGGRSRPDAFTGATDFSHTWSYGGGISLGLSRALQITGEARQRAMRATGETQWHSTGGAEIRLGAMFHL